MPDFSRRQFLKIMAVSAAGAGAIAYTGCTPFPTRNDFLTESPATIPNDLVSGSDNWYATVCRGCGAGCGTIVRVYEGLAQKVEGNPDYPVNRGKLCARGQTAVQTLYHPDRFRGPLRRTGDRFKGRLEAVTWDSVRSDLVSRVRGAAANGSLLVITAPLPGHRAFAIDRFTKALGGQYAIFEPLPNTQLRAAVKRVFGQDQLPVFDIARAQYVLSFGADFLGTWLSPVQYNLAYGEFRQGRPNRGYFVQVEPRLSQTGANADEWLPVRPGTEGLLALSIAQVMVSQGLADQASRLLLGPDLARSLAPYAPDRVTQAIGISADRIAALTRAFAGQRPALAIGGDSVGAHTNGSFNLTAIYMLNILAGNAGKPGGVMFDSEPPFTDLPAALGGSFADWQQVTNRLRTGQPKPVSMALVHSANPVYGLPGALGFGEALAKVPYIVSFSSFPDETTDLADLILPDHVALEAWGDDVPTPGTGIPTVGLQQPLVVPLYDTRDFVDVMLSLAPDLGADVQKALPWENYRDLLRAAMQRLQKPAAAGGPVPSFEEFWNTMQQKGGYWQEQVAGAAAPSAPAAAAPSISLPPNPPQPNFAGDAQEYRYNLVAYPHLALGTGEMAYLPWMQATTEPTVSAVWQTWIELHPDTAREIGVRKGDIVAVQSPNGTIEVPAYPYPAIPRDVVAIPLGQGHHSAGRWAQNRGANPIAILAPLTDSETGALAWSATRVKLSRTGRKMQLPTYEFPGITPTRELEPGQVVQISPE